MKQLTHRDTINLKLDKDIIVISEHLRTPENIGMLFRISEAFGVKKVFLIGNSPNLDNKKVQRTARSTDKALNIQYFNNSQEIILQLKTQNYYLLGLELTDSSQNIQEIDYSKYDKIALFIGAERFGISENTLNQLNNTVHINLFGKNSSINVINALGITLYEITK